MVWFSVIISFHILCGKLEQNCFRLQLFIFPRPLPLHHVCRFIPVEKDQLRGQILQQQQQQRTSLREPGPRHQEPGAELGESGAELREPGAELWEPGAEEREQGPEPRQWESGAHRDAPACQQEVCGKRLLVQEILFWAQPIWIGKAACLLAEVPL